MKKIADVAALPLQWSQPRALKREYELRASGDLAATLAFRSAFGTFATGESGDGCWTFKRAGFFQQRVNVRRCSAPDTDVAVFRNSTWSQGGTLELPGGRRFLGNTNLWNTKFNFTNEAEEPLVKLHYGGVFKLKADVEIVTRAAALTELPVIVLTAWYLAVMLHQDATMAAS